MNKLVLSIDQGTTGTTCLLIDSKTYQIISSADEDYPQIYPQPSWVEHNLNNIWDTVKNCTLNALKKANRPANDIICIGITNQRETTCAFDLNGNPLANAIVWQDRRTSEFCNEKKKFFNEKYSKLTGLPLDPYFSATKMRWLLKNNSAVIEASKNKNLKFGTIDTFLLYKLSGNKCHATEASNASRTLLMNLDTCNWSDELLDFFEIKKEYLPEIKDSFSYFGETNNLDFLPNGIPITGILGDQQSALFGQNCTQEGQLKCTYGTGAFLLLNTGNKKVYSQNGLLTTVAYKTNNKVFYAIEGSSYIAGAAVQWLRDNLKIIQSSTDIESLASLVHDLNETKNILFMPFFTGIASPYWVSEAKAAIVGLTRDSNNHHIARACLEGIALSVNDSVKTMEKDTNQSIKEIKVDGGATQNNLLMQIQSNFSNKLIFRPKNIETTAMGAAAAALVGLGQLKIDQLSDIWMLDKTFNSEQNLNYYIEKCKLWDSTIKKLFLN